MSLQYFQYRDLQMKKFHPWQTMDPSICVLHQACRPIVSAITPWVAGRKPKPGICLITV